MAFNNQPFWDFVHILEGQQRNERPAASPQRQESAAGPETYGPQSAQFVNPFAAFAPFFTAPPNHRFGGPGRGRRGRAYQGGRCPAMNPVASQSPPRESEDARAATERPCSGGATGSCHRGPPSYGAFSGPDTGAPFDLSGLINLFASHPIANVLRDYVDESTRATSTGSTDPNTAPADSGETTVNEEADTFTPAVDVFSTPTSYVMHVALPGAQKEDVGVNWDAEKGELNIAGVVYRAGDEKFIEALKKKERRVGMFERIVKLPLADEEKVEIDSDDISAKLEDGVLVITVGKIAKEETWTDLKRVEIQ